MDENNMIPHFDNQSTPPQKPEDEMNKYTPNGYDCNRASFGTAQQQQPGAAQQQPGAHPVGGNSSSYPYYNDRINMNQNYNRQATQPVYTPPVSQPKKEKPKKDNKFAAQIGKIAILAVVFGVIAGVIIQGIDFVGGKTINKQPVATVQQSGNNSSGNGNVSQIATGTNDGKVQTVYDVSDVVKNTMPAMVAIDTTIIQNVQIPFYMFGFGQSYEQESTGSGSGIIISQNDKHLYLVTNQHVIEGATSITVTFCDDTSVEATVKGYDEDADLAVVEVDLDKISKETLNTIKIAVMGNSSSLQLGEPAIAIGNAMGFGQSVTVGHISALEKEVQLTDKTMTLVQTDAAINPGNSGGALINAKGEVIGINSVKLASTDVEGIGYAIPINSAQPIIEALINGTALPESEKAYLGISGSDVTKQYQERFGMPQGVYVTSVTENSPAAKAGMKNYDIITGFDGAKVASMDDLTGALAKKKAGETVTITVMRSDSASYSYGEISLTVTLDSVSNVPEDNDDRQQQQQNNNAYGYGNGFNFFD